MAKKVQQVPSAAYIEDYDDQTGDVVDGTRQSANIAAKRSKSDIRPGEFGHLDFASASDSGYSSRTTTTGGSGQSRASGRPEPGSLTINTSAHSRVTGPPPPPLQQTRVKESRKEKGKQREEKRASADMIHMERQRHANDMAAPVRSPSKSNRRESASMQHQQDIYWGCLNGYHNVHGMHPPPPMDPRAAYASSYYYQQGAPPVQNIPPASPQSTQFGYPYGAADVMIAQSRQRRPSRSSTYHSDNRPMSFHGGMQEPVYNPGALPMGQYERTPSVYSGYFTQPPTPRQQYYAEPDSPYQAIYERSSISRPRDQARRGSIYGRAAVDQSTPKASYEEGSFLERQISREHRPRRMSQSQRRPETYDEDESFYRMPPPPPPKPKVVQPKVQPKIIHQKRPDLTHKAATTGSMPPPTNRRMSQSRDSWDMSELKQALPHQQIRKISAAPERSRSMRTRRTSYHESESGRQIAVEDSRRRRTQYHDEEPSIRDVPEVRERPMAISEMEQKQRNAEEYQASKSGRSGVSRVPLTEDALRMKAKIAQRVDSDSGSQKTRSNSSRGSDARTRDGSGVGSRVDDDGGFTMTMNGMTIGFTHESVTGKRIHLRTNDHGSIGLNIEAAERKLRMAGAPEKTDDLIVLLGDPAARPTAVALINYARNVVVV
ncbi:conserved hypothetical protein [Talaromyces stipitatus ATCC 10500]|uniref:Uncharacterized protein n=1 Tax=Talaromyces stipitatus (strain ATCC 10500 / CBS 375.48 / QM 6759 / NRRL 1006) TaxID=441959 RepID=B8M5G6_TALSN|nr:uncharacterized protein TSTA_030390 [Talaromyces stipitatus ATCC 10500]EED19772.1 conserved hypothetical protein [Talaromyces stipitatus ATCC 10500]